MLWHNIHPYILKLMMHLYILQLQLDI